MDWPPGRACFTITCMSIQSGVMAGAWIAVMSQEEERWRKSEHFCRGRADQRVALALRTECRFLHTAAIARLSAAGGLSDGNSVGRPTGGARQLCLRRHREVARLDALDPGLLHALPGRRQRALRVDAAAGILDDVGAEP